MTSAFSRVYEEDIWEGGSGRGSTPDNTKDYRECLEAFIRGEDIKSVVDLGCGDWQFSQHVDWQGASYHGVDTVPSVMRQNQERFGSRASFSCLDISTAPLPQGELVILKDVLQHWPTKTIVDFLPRLSQYKWALVTNCGTENDSLNSDVAMTGYRPLDLRLEPFNVKADDSFWYRTDEVGPNELNKLVLIFRP
jgi:SAM-dependent methyltransferase